MHLHVPKEEMKGMKAENYHKYPQGGLGTAGGGGLGFVIGS